MTLRINLPRLFEPDRSIVPRVSQILSTLDGNQILEVDEPEAADLILFADLAQLGDRASSVVKDRPEYRAHRSKVVVYDERDFPWCAFPGVYVSMPARSFTSRWQVAGSYWSVERLLERLPPDQRKRRPEHLAGFVGSNTDACRQSLFTIRDERMLIREVKNFIFYDQKSEQFAARRISYAEDLLRSKFAICPRGHGTSSFRLYEALSAGRVPVIVSDHWVPPSGPDWASFSIQVPEAEVQRLPVIISAYESRWEEMARAAEAAFETWFAPTAAVEDQLSQLSDVLRSGSEEFPRFGVVDRQRARAAARRVVSSGKKLARRPGHSPRGTAG